MESCSHLEAKVGEHFLGSVGRYMPSGCPSWGCFNLYLFIYSAAYLQREGSSIFVVACGILVVACGIWFPDQGLNPGPLHWACEVLAIRPPRKSLRSLDIGAR